MLFRGDLLISVTVQGILMSANAQAKGLLAELMQCHPALVVCGHWRYYNCRHSDCKADRGAGTDATKSFVNAIKPHLGSEYRLAILCGSHHCYFSLASGAQGWVRNSVAAEAIMNNAQHPVPPSSPQTHDIGIESASAIPSGTKPLKIKQT